ncbi:uncharacterized protein LOC134853934 isoform X2 [Symsagittifera roscoffensis]|uniref:uncharacterized protein LOC134853934 isoform X2 n=1 Tax=Symsagittifera roscoffensis TaxID=84072 RepID=UPI00307C2E4B
MYNKRVKSEVPGGSSQFEEERTMRVSDSAAMFQSVSNSHDYHQRSQMGFTKKQAAFLSPQPYKPTLRNSIADQTDVIEEAVVKVKENPFKFLEAKQLRTATRVERSGNQIKLEEPRVSSPYAEKSFRSPGIISDQNFKNKTPEAVLETDLNNSHDSLDYPVANDYSQVRNLFEKSSRNGKTEPLRSPTNFQAQGKLSNANYQSNNNLISPFSQFDVKLQKIPGKKVELSQNVSSRNVVSNEVTLPVYQDGTVDFTQNEMPAPNTVSNLKSVWERKSPTPSHNAAFGAVKREKSPTPMFKETKSASPTPVLKAGNYAQSTRSMSDNNLSQRYKSARLISNELDPNKQLAGTNMGTSTQSSSSVNYSMGTSNPVKTFPLPTNVLENKNKSKIEVLPIYKEVNDGKKVSNIESQRTVSTPNLTALHSKQGNAIVQQQGLYNCNYFYVESYMPKFVHEYKSDKLTHLMNSIIRDSFTYRLIPKEVSRFEPEFEIVMQHAPVTAKTSTGSGNQYFASSVSNSQQSVVQHAFNSQPLNLNLNTPEVILIEKQDSAELDTGKAESDFKMKDSIPKNITSGIPAAKTFEVKTPEVEGGSTEIFATGPKSASASVKIVPKEDQVRGPPFLVEQVGLPLVTSFKNEPNLNESPTPQAAAKEQPGLVSDARKIEGPRIRPREKLTIVVEPPPSDLKSCINQKGKEGNGSSSGSKRKISFHEDVYVHEYPIVFWTSEEELRENQLEQMKTPPPNNHQPTQQQTFNSSSANSGNEAKQRSEPNISDSIMTSNERLTAGTGATIEDDSEPAPLASHEDDLFSPWGSTTDVNTPGIAAGSERVATSGNKSGQGVSNKSISDGKTGESRISSNDWGGDIGEFKPSVIANALPLSPDDINNNNNNNSNNSKRSGSQKKKAPVVSPTVLSVISDDKTSSNNNSSVNRNSTPISKQEWYGASAGEGNIESTVGNLAKIVGPKAQDSLVVYREQTTKSKLSKDPCLNYNDEELAEVDEDDTSLSNEVNQRISVKNRDEKTVSMSDVTDAENLPLTSSFTSQQADSTNLHHFTPQTSLTTVESAMLF